MKGIYNYILEKTHVSTLYNITAILYFQLIIILFPMLTL